MRWALAALIVLGASAVMIVAILLVRRRAPEGGYFNDGDRASGVFGPRDGVRAPTRVRHLSRVHEVRRVPGGRGGRGAGGRRLFETAQLMPPDAGPELAGELECYARSVVHVEWPAMESGGSAEAINPWGLSMLSTLEGGRAGDRERTERLRCVARADERPGGGAARPPARGGRGRPLPVWIVLLLSAGLVLLYLLFFADSGERAVVQGLLAGSVTAVVAASLLVLLTLNKPYSQEIGGSAGRDATIAGDHRGRPRRVRPRRPGPL